MKVVLLINKDELLISSYEEIQGVSIKVFDNDPLPMFVSAHK